jgi:hypothetical protein
MMSEDHNYLEGLRHADMQKQLKEVQGDDYEQVGVDERLRRNAASADTQKNWSGITTQNNVFAMVRSNTYEKIPDEHEFLPGMSSHEMYPLEHDDHNISKQLVGHVDKLSRMAARRPPTDYHVKVEDASHWARAKLIHTPTGSVVGDLEWHKEDGFVNNLEVEVGHRHMTNYFATQAWNHSRSKGKYGPAASDMLSPFSEKIVNKYNPNSADFKKFKSMKDAECPSCRDNPGLAVLTPRATNEGRHVEYSVPELHVKTIPNTGDAHLTFDRTALGNAELVDATEIRNPDTGRTHLWDHLEIRCPNCDGSGLSAQGRMRHGFDGPGPD